MIIYKTTNLINGKIYVGQSARHNDAAYLGSGKFFLQAVKDFGLDNFKKEILESCSELDVDAREMFWIKELDARNPAVGYNKALGGSRPPSCVGRRLSEESKAHLSYLRRGDKNPMYGKPGTFLGKRHSDLSRKKLSLALKGKVTGNKNPFFGKTFSLELKKRISFIRFVAYLGEGNPFYGKSHSEKTKKAIGIANSRYPRTDLARQRMAAAQRARQQRLRFQNFILSEAA